MWAQRLHHCRTDRNVRHKMPIHDIDMYVVGPGFRHRTHFLTQPREVGRQN